MSRDSPAISSIEYRIARVELANSYAKKSTVIHQNKKKLIRLQQDLERAVYRHNKLDLFQALEEEITKRLIERYVNEFAVFKAI